MSRQSVVLHREDQPSSSPHRVRHQVGATSWSARRTSRRFKLGQVRSSSSTTSSRGRSLEQQVCPGGVESQVRSTGSSGLASPVWPDGSQLVAQASSAGSQRRSSKFVEVNVYMDSLIVASGCSEQRRGQSGQGHLSRRQVVPQVPVWPLVPALSAADQFDQTLGLKSFMYA